MKCLPCTTQSRSFGKKTRLKGMGWPGQGYRLVGDMQAGRLDWKEDLPWALWGSVLFPTHASPGWEVGPVSFPRQERQRHNFGWQSTQRPICKLQRVGSSVSGERAETDSLPTPPFTLSKPWSPGSLLSTDVLFLAAGPVSGAEEQAARDQVEVHAAAEVLPEQRGAHLRGLHLQPPEAAGLRGRGPCQAADGALQPPGSTGGLQEKVSLFRLHPATEPRANYANSLGLGLPIYKVL